MKPQELRAKTNEELATELEAGYKELLQLRVRLATKQLANYNILRGAKRNIARIHTIIKERQLART